jgi:hypothetical protein
VAKRDRPLAHEPSSLKPSRLTRAGRATATRSCPLRVPPNHAHGHAPERRPRRREAQRIQERGPKDRRERPRCRFSEKRQNRGAPPHDIRGGRWRPCMAREGTAIVPRSLEERSKASARVSIGGGEMAGPRPRPPFLRSEPHGRPPPSASRRRFETRVLAFGRGRPARSPSFERTDRGPHGPRCSMKAAGYFWICIPH